MASTKKDFVTGKKNCTLTNIKKSSLNTEQFPSHEFDLDEFVDNPSISMIGKRGAGKSWLIKNIIHHQLQKEKIDEIIVFAPREKMEKFYGTFIENVQFTLNFDMLKQILEIQSQNIEEGNHKKLMIVFDDCCGQKGNWTKDPAMQEILFNGRHYHISYIFSMQFPIGLTPELRNNFDYIFLLYDDIISNIKRIYDHYAGAFPTFDTFRQVYNGLTEDYSSMIIINRGIKVNIHDKIKWFKANNVSFTGKIPSIIKNNVEDYKHLFLTGDFNFLSTEENEKYPKKKNQFKTNMFDVIHLENEVANPIIKKKPTYYVSQSGTSTPHTSSSLNSPVNTGTKANDFINKTFDDEMNMSFVESPKKNVPKTNSAKEIIELYDHLKGDIKNKNKYDVLYEIVKCNEAIIKNGILLNENKINSIISANLKIAELCGTPKLQNDVELELEDIESSSC